MSFIVIPVVVCRLIERSLRHSLRVLLNCACSSSKDPDRTRIWISGVSTRVGTSKFSFQLGCNRMLGHKHMTKGPEGDHD